MSKLAHYYTAMPPLKTGIKMKSWWLFFQTFPSITNYGFGGSSVKDKGLSLIKSKAGKSLWAPCSLAALQAIALSTGVGPQAEAREAP